MLEYFLVHFLPDRKLGTDLIEHKESMVSLLSSLPLGEWFKASFL